MVELGKLHHSSKRNSTPQAHGPAQFNTLTMPPSETAPSLSPHSLESVQQKHMGRTTIGLSTMNAHIDPKSSTIDVALYGPQSAQKAFSLLKPSSWRSPIAASLHTRIVVGSEDCQSWDDANTILTAMKLLLTNSEGLLTPACRDAISSRFPNTTLSLSS